MRPASLTDDGHQAARSPSPSHLITLALIVVATIGAWLLSYHFFARPVRPWPDQGWVLQAAVRHAAGKGLTTTMNGSGHDLATSHFARLVYFPPGYPLVISSLIRLGCTVDRAVKIVNMLTMIVGITGWMLLATAFLPRTRDRVFFAALLVLACGALVPKGGTMDYVMWGAAPYWLMGISGARRSTGGRGRLFWTVIASLIVSFLISFRWAAAFLTPAGDLAILLPGGRDPRMSRRFGLAFLYGIFPLSTFLALGAINHRVAGEGSIAAFLPSNWQPQRLLTLYPLQSLFAIPTGISSLLDRIWRMVEPAMLSTAGKLVFEGLIPAALVLAIGVLVRRGRTQFPAEARSLLTVIGVLAVSLLLFLGWMTLRHGWENVDWSYLDEPRYYRPFLPAFLLFWLLLFDKIGSWGRRAAVITTTLVLSIVYLLQADIRWERSFSAPDESWELVQKVRSLGQLPGRQVVLDMDVSDYIIEAPPNLSAGIYPSPRDWNHDFFSQPVDLWLVRRPREVSAYILDKDSDRKIFEAARQRFGATRVWMSSTGRFELYHAHVDNQAGEQRLKSP